MKTGVFGCALQASVERQLLEKGWGPKEDAPADVQTWLRGTKVLAELSAGWPRGWCRRSRDGQLAFAAPSFKGGRGNVREEELPGYEKRIRQSSFAFRGRRKSDGQERCLRSYLKFREKEHFRWWELATRTDTWCPEDEAGGPCR